MTLPHRQATRCRLCGAPLAAGASTDLCDKPVCKTRAEAETRGRIGARWLQRRERAAEIAQARTAPVFEELARRMGLADASDLPTTITPCIGPSCVARDHAEILDFLDHLSTIVRQVFDGEEIDLSHVTASHLTLGEAAGGATITRDRTAARTTDGQPATLADAFAQRDREAAPDPLELNAACIACGGDCCTTGLRHHAYLKPLDIAYYRHHRPEATAASVIADYLSRIPEKSVSAGCLYQGETGCVLPRDLRSTTCNGWHCGARKQLAARLRDSGGTRSAVVALAADHATMPEEGAPMMRVVTVENGELTFHDDLRLPALAPDGTQPPQEGAGADETAPGTGSLGQQQPDLLPE